MTDSTTIKVTWLVSKESDILKGKQAILEDLKANLEILFEYEDITKKEFEYWLSMIETDFDKAMDLTCDMLELDYEYLVV